MKVKLNKYFLIMGILLSICSKVLQFQFGSFWGDVIILPAAVFFVLAILLYIPKYKAFLQNDMFRKKAIVFALFCCLTVLFFQPFTMVTFGKGIWRGLFLLAPFLIFGGSSIFIWFYLLKSKSSK